MYLKNINDRELLSQTKQLVQNERQLLTKILHHLREVERRKLFCDLGFQSLFEYAVKKLKYSEGQAGRRIQGMRLIKELPEVEEKIEMGKLSLSNLSQAQSYFRERKKLKSAKAINLKEKLQILKSLENKSAREGQRVLLQLQPEKPLPKERERVITEKHSEIRFVISNELKDQLEELRSLLGPKGTQMSFNELVIYMTELSLKTIKRKKFGKNRTQKTNAASKLSTQPSHSTPMSELQSNKNPRKISKPTRYAELSLKTCKTKKLSKKRIQNINSASRLSTHLPHLTPTSELQIRKNPRYISKSTHYALWKNHRGKCTNCGSRRNLNIDHIQPVALGGGSAVNNLQLLCFHCNQRQAMKVFGVGFMLAKSAKQLIK